MSCSATLENDLSAGINISHRNRGFETGDRGNRDGRFLLGVVFFFLIGLIVDLGEQFGGDARATDQRAELCMFDGRAEGILARRWRRRSQRVVFSVSTSFARERSEEHTSELQSRPHLVCRLLLEKKKM